MTDAVLTSKQRQYLRGLGHPLSPVVRVGKAGVTDGVIAETVIALESHELIKVRIDVDGTAERRPLIARLAEATGAQVAGAVGKVAIFFRQREENPRIKLPR